jgi:hypothetical protein
MKGGMQLGWGPAIFPSAPRNPPRGYIEQRRGVQSVTEEHAKYSKGLT